MRLALAFALSFVAAAPAFAAEIHVTLKTDDPSGNEAGSLRAALTFAHDGDTIVIDVDEIFLTGPLDISNSNLTLCGNGVGIRPAYSDTNSPINVNKDGVTIKGLVCTDLSIDVDETVTDTTIVDSTFIGGDEHHDAVTAVKAKRTRIGAPGKPCRFQGCDVYTLFCEDVTISDSTFDGGGVNSHDDDGLTVTGNTFNGKKQRTRGAGIAVATGATGTADVGGNSVTGFTKGKTGVGISVATQGGTITLHDNTVTGNAVGVAVGKGAGHVVATGNAVGTNSRGGWQCANGSTCSISGGTCTSNRGAGITCAAGSLVTISQVAQGGNTGAGISVAKGANGDTAAPQRVFHDYATGKLAGWAHAGDIVEMFETEPGLKNAVAQGGEGAKYIGSAIAGADGKFTYPATGRFPVSAGGLVTCTSTSASGTSPWGANTVCTEGDVAQSTTTATAAAEPLGALVTDGSVQKIVTFHVNSLGTASSSVVLTGLQTGEHLLGIDIFQLDLKLYALSDQFRMYTVDPATGVCKLVGTGPVPLSPPLAGTHFEITMGTQSQSEMRVVSDAGENRWLTPISYLLSNNGSYQAFNYAPLTGTTPHIVALAMIYYPFGSVGWQGNLYYGIDAQTSVLVVDDGYNESEGEIKPVGQLGFTVGTVQGFDASLFTGDAFLAATPSGETVPHLYSVNLATGAAADRGAVTFAGVTGAVTSFCFLPPPPIPVTLFSDKGNSYDLTVTPGVLGTPQKGPSVTTGKTVLASTKTPNGAVPGEYALVDSTGTVTINEDSAAQPWSVQIPNFDATAPARIACTDLHVSVTDGTRMVGVSKSLQVIESDVVLTYAPGDPNFGRTPNIVAATGAPADGSLPSGTLVAVDQDGNSINQFTVIMNPTSGSLTTLGPTGTNSTLSRAAMTTLANGNVVLETQDNFLLNTYRVNPVTGAATFVAYADQLPGGEKLVGVGQQPYASGTTRLGLFVRKFFEDTYARHAGASSSQMTVTGDVTDTAAPAPIAGAKVTLVVGGLERDAVLDSKGQAKVDGATFKFTAATATKPLAFSVAITGADIPGGLADAGMDGTVAASKETRDLEVRLTVDGYTSSYSLKVRYTAIPDEWATVSFVKPH